MQRTEASKGPYIAIAALGLRLETLPRWKDNRYHRAASLRRRRALPKEPRRVQA
ncbi:hypothetical protein EKH55_2005 [Sinorhizobium alkalisoli]|nr:hypothetical protein EKH55_2005 [Sinorhizobium alkalisoli]